MRPCLISIALLAVASPLTSQSRLGPPRLVPVAPISNRAKPIRVNPITPKAEPVTQDVAIPFVPNCVAFPVGTDFSKVYIDPAVPPQPVKNTDPIDLCTGKPTKDRAAGVQ